MTSRDLVTYLDARYKDYLVLLKEAESEGRIDTMTEIKHMLYELRVSLRQVGPTTTIPERTGEQDSLSNEESRPNSAKTTSREDHASAITIEHIAVGDAPLENGREKRKDDLSDQMSLKKAIEHDFISERGCPILTSSPIAEETFDVAAKLCNFQSRLRCTGRDILVDKFNESHQTEVQLSRSLPPSFADTRKTVTDLPLFRGDRKSVQERFSNAMSAPRVNVNPFG